jgi:hypothetical protein
MLVTLFGKVIDLSKEHAPNALPPILVTLSGMVIEVSELHLENANSPMLVTPLPIEAEVMYAR